MTDHESYAGWDAAYVLGALTPADRRVFQAHLDRCDQCRAAVAELTSVPGLLARARPFVDMDPAAHTGPPPGTVAAVVRRRRRIRRTRMLLGAAAAVVLVVLAVAVPQTLPLAPAATVTLEPAASSTLTAKAELSPVPWGTRIAMECGYPQDTGDRYGGGRDYALVVADDDGEVSQVATWTAVPGETIRIDAATAVPLERIATLEVRSAGATVLTADLGR